jgi:hypothetical protein
MKLNIKSKKTLVQNQPVKEQSNWLSKADTVSDTQADRINGGGFLDPTRLERDY